MNTIQMIAIALPMTLLLACGGGGGGSSAAVAPTTPPTTTPTSPNPLTNLNNFMPTANSSTIEDVIERVGATNTDLDVSDQADVENFGSETTQAPCSNDTCNFSLLNDSIDVVILTLNVEDISLVRNRARSFSQYNSRVTDDVSVGDVNLARGNLQTTAVNNTPVEFETFAGWLDGSVFGTTQIEFGATGSEEYRFVSYTVGIPSGSNPTTTGSQTTPATWDGVAVASIKADRTFILGDAEITVNFMDSNVDLMFDDWRGLDNQAVSGMSAITYNDLALSSGSFTGSGNEQVSGRFYGADHAEVGGFFNSRTVTGAFGGTRQ